MILKTKLEETKVDLRLSPTDAFSDLVEAERRGARRSKADFGGPPLERRSISEQVVNRITAMIKSGNLRPGDQLPTEAQMTIAFGISRPPLREALKALTIMGMLASRQGGRYTVTNLSPSRLVAPFNVMLSGADYDAEVHFEARETVEIELVRLCAERASSETRQRILKLAVDGRAFHQNPVAFRLLDLEFHEALYVGGRNSLLSAVAQALYDLGLEIRRVASAAPGVIERSVRQHVEVAEALVDRDPAAATAAYRRHLEHVRDSTIQSMGSVESN